MMETLHWKTLFSSTSPAENPSTGCLHRSETNKYLANPTIEINPTKMRDLWAASVGEGLLGSLPSRERERQGFGDKVWWW